MRKISLETFRRIESEGLLSKLRFRVYKIIFDEGPLTQAQARELTGLPHQSITPRFSELERLGVINQVRETLCPITGRTVMLWDVTDLLPNNKNPKSLVAKIDEQIAKCKKKLKLLHDRRESILKKEAEANQMDLFGLGSSGEEHSTEAHQ